MSKDMSFIDLISIVIPLYNVDKYVVDCLNGIFKQTYNKIEIILVDDGSTDNSGAICYEFDRIDDRIVVIHQEHKGLSCARNA